MKYWSIPLIIVPFFWACWAVAIDESHDFAMTDCGQQSIEQLLNFEPHSWTKAIIGGASGGLITAGCVGWAIFLGHISTDLALQNYMYSVFGVIPAGVGGIALGIGAPFYQLNIYQEKKARAEMAELLKNAYAAINDKDEAMRKEALQYLGTYLAKNDPDYQIKYSSLEPSRTLAERLILANEAGYCAYETVSMPVVNQTNSKDAPFKFMNRRKYTLNERPPVHYFMVTLTWPGFSIHFYLEASTPLLLSAPSEFLNSMGVQ